MAKISLRALLIHKGTKQLKPYQSFYSRLRALLIHKGTKQKTACLKIYYRLRALLIHKGTKLCNFSNN